MKIQYKRSGGIANIVKQMEIESTDLPDDLQRVVNSLTSLQLDEPLHSDDFFHELRLEDGRTIRCTDSRCPQALVELFDFFLTQRHRDTEK